VDINELLRTSGPISHDDAGRLIDAGADALDAGDAEAALECFGARINQATGIVVADRPTCAQEFVDIHPLSVCDRLGLRRPALIRCEKSSKVCVKFRALRAGARHEEWRCNLTH